MYHDTHAHKVQPAVFDLLADLTGRADVPGVLLEHDDRCPAEAELNAELDAIAAAAARGAARRGTAVERHPPPERSERVPIR
jgi:uncharacterized protein (UPF0276 family)